VKGDVLLNTLSLVERKRVCFYSWVKTVIGELEDFCKQQGGEWTGKTTFVLNTSRIYKFLIHVLYAKCVRCNTL
jgi:hypothetical protein